MLDNLCKNELMSVLNEARHVAQGREGCKEGYLNLFKTYLSEARARLEIEEKNDIVELLREDFLLGFKVTDKSLGLRLLEVAKDVVKKDGVLLSVGDYILLPLEEWLSKPTKSIFIEQIINKMFDINYYMPDNSPSAMKSLTA